MQESNLLKDFTLQEVQDEFDFIEGIEMPGRQLQVGKMTNRGIDLYAKLRSNAAAFGTLTREFKMQLQDESHRAIASRLFT